jgi:cystathionine gamma-synthase
MSDKNKQPPGKTPATLSVHGGEDRTRPQHALTEPIVQTATYSFPDTRALTDYMEGKVTREEYGRYGNPTVRAAEQKLAALEGTDEAAAFGSGMAAMTTAILALTKAGSHVVLFNDCYRRTRQFVTKVLERFGVASTLVPPGDLEALGAALRPDTRLVISEAPTNPYQSVVDLRRLAKLCGERGVKTLIDATFATPVNMRAAEHGIDLIVHSGTKYLSGHNDVLAGFVAGPAGLVSLLRELRDVTGAILDPHAAYLVLRGMKTLAVRVTQQNKSALALAQALEAHPRVRRVWYPGLPSHPHHAVARELMTGFGGIVTFAVKGSLDDVSRFVDACRIPRIAPSLGGVESLIEQPALMSYFELSTEQREAVGITDDLVRYAVGLEDIDELIADVRAALDSADRSAPTASRRP